MNRPRCILSLSFAMVVLALCLFPFFPRSAWASAVPADRWNVLLITLDTTRADHLGCYGHVPASTPHLDELARQGLRCEQCLTPVPLTLPAHCSLFTGRYPVAHGVRGNGNFYLPEREETLAEILRQHDYQTKALVAAYVLQGKFGLRQGFAEYDDGLQPDEALTTMDSEIGADEVYARFHTWLCNRAAGKFFAWVHFYDPHAPYHPPLSFQERAAGNPYAGEIAFVDEMIGNILADLRRQNLWQNTMVIVVGDHGEAFGEHGEFEHGFLCYQETLRVPLIISQPGVVPAGRVVAQQVSLIDVMPTILDLLGLAIPGQCQGKSFKGLLAGQESAPERLLYFESMYGREEMGWAPLLGIMRGESKYIRLPQAELYDLAADPEEKHNLYWKKNVLAKELDRLLRRSLTQFAASGGESRRSLSDEDRQRLNSLGYLSSFASSASAANNTDPKEGVRLIRQCRDIDACLNTGRLAEAKSLLQELRRSAGRSLPPQYYGFREQVNEREGNEAAAVATLAEALQRFPENNEFRMNLAYYRLRAGDLAKAEVLGREAIKRDARFTRAYILLATVAERRADLARAADLLARAVALEPQNLSLKIRHAHSLGRAGATERMLVICRELLQQDIPALSGAAAEIRSRVIAVLAELGQGQRYDSQIRQLLNPQGNEAEGWDNLGQYLWRRKLSTEAERAFRQAMQLRPGVPAFHVNLATLLLTLAISRPDDALRRQALAEFNLAIGLDQKSVLAYNGRASAYKFGGQVNEALADWQTAITLRPTFPDPYLNSGITLLEAGRKQEALERFRACLRQCGRQLGDGERKRLERLLSEAQR